MVLRICRYCRKFLRQLQDLIFESIKIIVRPHEQEQWAQRAIEDKNPIWALQECEIAIQIFRVILIVERILLRSKYKTMHYKILVTSKTLNYTSIGSGELLFDLFVLTQFINDGYDTINVRFIDLEYEEFFNNYKNPNQDDYEYYDTTISLVQFLEWFNIYFTSNLKS